MRMYLAAFLLAAAACGGASSDAPTTTRTTSAMVAEPAPVSEPAPATEPAPADGDLPPEVVVAVEQTVDLLTRLADAVEAGGCDGISARLDATVTDADVAMMQGYKAREAEFEPYEAEIKARYLARIEAVVTRIIAGSQGCGAEVRAVFARLEIGVHVD